MITLQYVQHAAPAPQQHVRAADPVETVTAVKPAEGSDAARNDLEQDTGGFAEEQALFAKKRGADPSDPVGPPPSFSANVLDAERERLREGKPVEPEQSSAADDADKHAEEDRLATKDQRGDAREAPQPTRSAYGGVREDAPRMLDVSR